ncbi:MAG: hypothetical protein NPMRth3_2800002 [Nitrosopumilales archaeon]|nr:MAG: hypothetical protein NPMRth3_2800002 [Nitrosopumilales archaeon]
MVTFTVLWHLIKNKFLTIISYVYKLHMMSAESHEKKKVKEKKKVNEKSIDLGLDWDDD